MKKQLSIILIILASFNSFSQISFEKGYYINNSGQLIRGEIKNIDWKNNPVEFEFRLLDTTESKFLTIQLVQEFGIDNVSKYVRSTVNMDRSSDRLNELTINSNPIFGEETLFLQVLFEGASNLYRFHDGNLVRFFYSKENQPKIEQLIFKRYLSSGSLVGENNGFRQQLFKDLKCDKISENTLKRLKYRKDDLVNFFDTYSRCSDSNSVNFDEKHKIDYFNLALRVHGNSSSLEFQDRLEPNRNIDFGNKINIGIGLEAEFILPFNKNKWAFFVEPTYRSFQAEKVLPRTTTSADYTSVELPIGLRHFFYLNTNSKIFVNMACVVDFNLKSNIYNFNRNFPETSNTANLAFGFGCKQSEKYSFELRYQTPRQLLNNNYQYLESNYKTVSLIFGYSFL